MLRRGPSQSRPSQGAQKVQHSNKRSLTTSHTRVRKARTHVTSTPKSLSSSDPASPSLAIPSTLSYTKRAFASETAPPNVSKVTTNEAVQNKSTTAASTASLVTPSKTNQNIAKDIDTHSKIASDKVLTKTLGKPEKEKSLLTKFLHPPATENATQYRTKMVVNMIKNGTIAVGRGLNKFGAGLWEVITDRNSPILPNMWAAIKRGAIHFAHGFKRLASNTVEASRLIRQRLNGQKLKRSERRFLIRVSADLFRLVPFLVIVLVPFLEFALPLILKLFPNLLPSTFTSAEEKQDKNRKEFQARLELADFLQDAVGQLTLNAVDKKREALERANKEKGSVVTPQYFHLKSRNDAVTLLVKLFKSIQTGASGLTPDEQQTLRLFKSEMSLDKLSQEQLVLLCKFMGLHAFGDKRMLRSRLKTKLDELRQDDIAIEQEGVDALDGDDLQDACHDRGINTTQTEQQMRAQLDSWIDLSVHERMPLTLLFLARASQLYQDLVHSDDSTTQPDPQIIEEARKKAELEQKEAEAKKKLLAADPEAKKKDDIQKAAAAAVATASVLTEAQQRHNELHAQELRDVTARLVRARLSGSVSSSAESMYDRVRRDPGFTTITLADVQDTIPHIKQLQQRYEDDINSRSTNTLLDDEDRIILLKIKALQDEQSDQEDVLEEIGILTSDSEYRTSDSDVERDSKLRQLVPEGFENESSSSSSDREHHRLQVEPAAETPEQHHAKEQAILESSNQAQAAAREGAAAAAVKAAAVSSSQQQTARKAVASDSEIEISDVEHHAEVRRTLRAAEEAAQQASHAEEEAKKAAGQAIEAVASILSSAAAAAAAAPPVSSSTSQPPQTADPAAAAAAAKIAARAAPVIDANGKTDVSIDTASEVIKLASDVVVSAHDQKAIDAVSVALQEAAEKAAIAAKNAEKARIEAETKAAEATAAIDKAAALEKQRKTSRAHSDSENEEEDNEVIKSASTLVSKMLDRLQDDITREALKKQEQKAMIGQTAAQQTNQDVVHPTVSKPATPVHTPEEMAAAAAQASTDADKQLNDTTSKTTKLDDSATKNNKQ